MVDRSRLYVLLAGLEIDLRALIRTWILPYKEEEHVFGGRYLILRARAEKEPAASDSVLDFADFSDAFEVLNRHREMLPGEVARAVKQATPRLEQFVGARNRVMHARPLQAGDLEAGLRLCLDLLDQPLPLPTLRDLITRLQNDPEWTPAFDANATAADATVVHNLPVPEFDETGLLGRDRLNADLLARLVDRRDRVITVVGEGGMGKTALVVKTLYDLVYLEESPFDAVLWASLKTERLTGEGVRAVRGAARDVVGVARHLALPLDDSFAGSMNDLGELLDGITTLIAIDNVESTSADEIVRFYDAMPSDCSFVLTSRVGLGQLERRLPLGPLDPKSATKMLRVLAERRGLSHLARLDNRQLEAQVDRLRGTPLAIRWYVEAVAAGSAPSLAIRDQSELLRFCLETIYHDLSEPARRCLAVLHAAGAAVDAPQLAVISDVDADALARALQDLQRRSLVETQQSGPEGLHERYRLTAATAQYLSAVDRPSGSVLKDVESRITELRDSEERRQQAAAASPTSPKFLEVTEEGQRAVAHLLRKALLAARKNADEARQLVEQAQALLPDYYEAYRVAGFIATLAGQHILARENYERASQLAVTAEARARVAYFYSWLLGSELGDIEGALGKARDADAELDLPETKTRVAQFLLYAKRFDEAERVLRPVLVSEDARSVLIARTQMLSLAKRHVEQLRAQNHGGEALRIGAEAIKEVSAYLDSGVTDATLRTKALELALETLQVAGAMPDLQGFETDVVAVARYGIRHVTELLVHRHRIYWIRASQRVRADAACPRVVGETLSELERLIELTEGTEELSGRLFSYDDERSYGFITQADASERIFFHRSDLRDAGTGILLTKGTPVRFTVRREDRGLRAGDVYVDAAGEHDLTRQRRVVVERKLPEYLFARETSTRTPVFVHSSTMRKDDWSRVQPGDWLIVDLELHQKGPRAVKGTVTPASAPETVQT